MSGKPLNARQQKFVQFYAKSGIGKQAAVDAGYSPSSCEQTAARLLQDPRICEAIQKLADSQKSKTIADIAELREFWTRIIRGEERDVNAAGLPVNANLTERQRATKLLGKSMGAFLDRLDHQSSDGSMTPPTKVEFVVVRSKD